MEFSRQGYWSGLTCTPPGDLPNSGIEPVSLASPALQADSLPLSNKGSPPSPLKVKVLIAQLYPTLCNLIDCSPPGSSVHGDFQARILKWVAISFSRGSNPHLLQVSCTAGGFFTAEPPEAGKDFLNMNKNPDIIKD